jgi:hypothetical protein
VARENADEAAEFGDDIKEADPDAEVDEPDGVKGGGSSAVSAAAEFAADGKPGAGGVAGCTSATPAGGELSMVQINTSLEGDDAFAADMMRKVEMSARRGEGLEAQLRPVERYAVRYLEETVRIMDGAGEQADAIAQYEEKEWELEQIEKQKAAAEAAVDEDDDGLIIEGWDTGAADEEYRSKVRRAQRDADLAVEYERREAERAARVYAPQPPASSFLAAVPRAPRSGSGSAGASREGTPGPGGAPAAGALRMKFRLKGPAPPGTDAGAGGLGFSGLRPGPVPASGGDFGAGGGAGAIASGGGGDGGDEGGGGGGDRDNGDLEQQLQSHKSKKSKKKEKRKDRGEGGEGGIGGGGGDEDHKTKKHKREKDRTHDPEKEERRRLRRLSKEHDRTAAAAAAAAAVAAVVASAATGRASAPISAAMAAARAGIGSVGYADSRVKLDTGGNP